MQSHAHHFIYNLQELISYFQKSEENSKVLEECKNSNNISVVCRRKIVNIVAKYVEETFEYNPPSHALLEISKLTVEIFPGLKATVGDVTVSYSKLSKIV